MLLPIRRLGVLASLALAAGLAACGSEPTTVSAIDGPALEAHRSSGAGGQRHANGRRYRDAGRHKWQGRSLTAAVTAEALVNNDGTLSLEATSYRAGDLSAPAGTITKLQVKLLDASGRQVAVLDFNHVSGNPVAVTIPAIPPGGSARLMAHVTGVAGRRTEVVVVLGITPILRPDLAVTNVDGPLQMVLGQPGVFSATVTELQGERGASANCVLYVNDLRTDMASAIWVDAGDAVSCAFTYSFPAVGTKVLRVAVEQVDPGDADLTNNSGTLTIVAAEAAVVVPDNFSFDGAIRDGDIQASDSFYTRWTEPGTGQLYFEQANSYRSSGRVQSAFFSATVGQALTPPLERLEVAMRSGGRLLHSARWTDLGATAPSDPACVSATSAGGFSVFLCAYAAAGFTTIQYVLSAGSVTYQSVEYNRVWNGATFDQSTYVENRTDPAVPVTPQVLGADFSFHISVTDGGATYAFGGAGPLAPFSESDVQPLTCATSVFNGPPTFNILACASSSYAFTGIAGALNGSGYLSRSPAVP